MRFITIVILLMGVLLAGYSQTNDWQKRIISQTKHPFASYINPHINDINVLIIDGHRFEHVRGVRMFYLPVPQTNAVLFVVDEKDYSVTYHFFKMDTDEDIAIHARSSVFGRTIGFSRGLEKNDITNRGDGKLILCNNDLDTKNLALVKTNLASVKSLYYLDIKSKTVMAEKTIFLDKAGNVIEERNASPPF